MPDFYLYLILIELPFLLLILRGNLRLSVNQLYLLIFLLGIVFTFLSFYFNSRKEAELGNNIDIASLFIIVWGAMQYAVVLPVLYFINRRKK